MVGYLSTRKRRSQERTGEEKDIPGGAGQGAPLGLWVLLFMIDCAGPKPDTTPVGVRITEPINTE